jgi:hypothetical protein
LIPSQSLRAIRILVEGSGIFTPRPEQRIVTVTPLETTQRVGVFDKALLGHALKIQLASASGHTRCDYRGIVTFEYGRGNRSREASRPEPDVVAPEGIAGPVGFRYLPVIAGPDSAHSRG